MRESQQNIKLKQILDDQKTSILNFSHTKRRYYDFNSWIDYVFDYVKNKK